MMNGSERSNNEEDWGILCSKRSINWITSSFSFLTSSKPVTVQPIISIILNKNWEEANIATKLLKLSFSPESQLFVHIQFVGFPKSGYFPNMQHNITIDFLLAFAPVWVLNWLCWIFSSYQVLHIFYIFHLFTTTCLPKIIKGVVEHPPKLCHYSKSLQIQLHSYLAQHCKYCCLTKSCCNNFQVILD